MIQRVGETVRHDRSYRIRPGAYAVLIRDGKVLLTHQAAPTSEFQIPGGGIDPGESPLPALHREIFEETGWRAAALRRLGAYRRFTYMPEYDLWAEKICHVYLGQPTLCLGPPTETDHTPVWVDARLAPSLVDTPGDEMFLDQVVRQMR